MAKVAFCANFWRFLSIFPEQCLQRCKDPTRSCSLISLLEPHTKICLATTLQVTLEKVGLECIVCINYISPIIMFNIHVQNLLVIFYIVVTLIEMSDLLSYITLLYVVVATLSYRVTTKHFLLLAFVSTASPFYILIWWLTFFSRNLAQMQCWLLINPSQILASRLR